MRLAEEILALLVALRYGFPATGIGDVESATSSWVAALGRPSQLRRGRGTVCR